MRFLLALTLLLLCLSSSVAEDVESVVALLEFVIDVDEETAAKCLATLRERVQSGEVTGEQRDAIRSQLGAKLREVLALGRESPLYLDTLMLATSWGEPQAAKRARELAGSNLEDVDDRIAAIDALSAARDSEFLDSVGTLLASNGKPDLLRSRLLGALGRYDSPKVAESVLAYYDKLPSDIQPQAIELLTQRSSWSRRLLQAISDKKLPTTVLNVNQVRALLSSSDKELVALVTSQWGAVRTERNPEREGVIRQMHDQLSQVRGDAYRGREVFNRVCGQCHKIYGTGQDVGPEITRNGRGSFEHLLSNVFDPSLVIGASYQARSVITADGRILTGLLAEDNEQRIVLKTQGGKLEIVPRDEVEEIAISKLSLMPEGLEKQLSPDQLADLFAFISLDQPPENPAATPIAGTPAMLIGPR
ncbi:MAG: c-type cytochrome [Planctomycetales bacterium]|nr:c-type cytochrome [Planctomycetales bacterium]